MTEQERMRSGALYRADAPELSADRARCRALLARYNQTAPEQSGAPPCCADQWKSWKNSIPLVMPASVGIIAKYRLLAACLMADFQLLR